VYDDDARDRRLAVTIWYPARAGTVEDTTNFDDIFPGRGAWEAPLRAVPVRLPLVLLSHGSGGTARISRGSPKCSPREGGSPRRSIIPAIASATRAPRVGSPCGGAPRI
jgi:hypothetical protein